jgi:hypothetical protein
MTEDLLLALTASVIDFACFWGVSSGEGIKLAGGRHLRRNLERQRPRPHLWSELPPLSPLLPRWQDGGARPANRYPFSLPIPFPPVVCAHLLLVAGCHPGWHEKEGWPQEQPFCFWRSVCYSATCLVQHTWPSTIVHSPACCRCLGDQIVVEPAPTGGTAVPSIPPQLTITTSKEG